MKAWIAPLLFAAILSGCAKVKEPEFRRIENFRVKKFDLTEGEIGLSATYYNPNNFGVAVKEAEAEVYLDSIYVGKFVQDNNVDVSRQSDFSIPLSGKIGLATALKLNLKNIDTRELLLQANGTVKVGKGGVFVKKPFNYSGRHKLSELDLGGIK